MEIKIFNTAVEVSTFVASEIIKAVTERPQLNLGLATGRTMDAVYYHLVKASVENQISYKDVNTFAVDEYIGLDEHSEESYEYYLKLHLYDQLDFSRDKTHIMDTSILGLDEAALNYENKISSLGNIDLQLLGIGRNGHIGLNEPGAAIDSRTRVVALTSSTRESNKSLFKNTSVPLTAMTMGLGTILESKRCLLVATGETKAQIIQKLVNGDVSSKVPASALKTHKDCILVLDKEAAKLI